MYLTLMQLISSVAKLFKNNLTTFNKAHSLNKKKTNQIFTHIPAILGKMSKYVYQ